MVDKQEHLLLWLIRSWKERIDEVKLLKKLNAKEESQKLFSELSSLRAPTSKLKFMPQKFKFLNIPCKVHEKERPLQST